MKNIQLGGLALLLSFAISQGMRDVYLSSVFGALGFFDIVFIAFGCATLIFTTALKISAPQEFKLLKVHWRYVLAINTTTAGAWLCYFGSLNLIEPSAVNMLFSGIAPVSVMLFATLGLRTRDKITTLTSERSLHFGILGTLFILAWIVLSGRSGMGSIAFLSGIGGVALATLSGCLITAETIYAKQMNDTGISATGVLAFRFVLIACIALIAMIFFGQTSLPSMNNLAIVDVTIKLALLIALPLILVQKGLALTSPFTASVVAAFGPSIVFFFQYIDGSIPTSNWVLSVTLLYAFFSVAGLIMRTLETSRESEEPSPHS